MQITMDKSEVVKVLKAKLAEAKKWDAEQEQKHRADEAVALAKFRDKLRTALKWDWKTLLAKSGRLSLSYDDRPSCPNREAPAIERVLTLVQHDRKETLQVFPEGDLQKAILWERPDRRSGKTVCD